MRKPQFSAVIQRCGLRVGVLGLLSCTTILLISSCRFLGGSDTLDVIPGEAEGADTVDLGQGYDSARKKIMNNFCLEGETTARSGNTKGQVYIKADMDYKSIVNNLDGHLGAQLNFPLFNAGANAELALDSNYNARSETHNIVWYGLAKKRTFKPKSIRMSKQGEAFTKDEGEKVIIQTKCGDEYISEIQYGASLFASLKVKYLNATDKKLIGGAFSLSAGKCLPGGAPSIGASVNAGLKKDKQDIAKRTTVTVRAVQNGGKPERLLAILPNNIVTCTLVNMQPCITAFNNIVLYAKKDLRNQLEGAKLPESDIVVDASEKLYDEGNAPPENKDGEGAKPKVETAKNPCGGSSAGGVSGDASSTEFGLGLADSGDAFDSAEGRPDLSAEPTSPGSEPVDSDQGSANAPSAPSAAPSASGGEVLNSDEEKLIKNWNVISVKTTRYADTGFDTQLRPMNGWFKPKKEVLDMRDKLEKAWIAEKENLERSEFLVSTAGSILPPNQAKIVEEIKKLCSDNIEALRQAQQSCLERPTKCEAYGNQALFALKKYDKSKLDIQDPSEKTLSGKYINYQLAGGYDFGSRFDDTYDMPDSDRIMGITFYTTSANSKGKDGANAAVHLVGFQISYSGGRHVSHGHTSSGESTAIDLSKDQVIGMKIYFGSFDTKSTPRITGLSLATKNSPDKRVTIGQEFKTFFSYEFPVGKELFIGFVGSNGAEIDSLGPVTRPL